MNRKKLALILVILVALVWFGLDGKSNGGLTGPGFKNILSKPTPSPTPIPTPAPPVAPKTFQFDKSIDLEVELEKVNPQILDSDFE